MSLTNYIAPIFNLTVKLNEAVQRGGGGGGTYCRVVVIYVRFDVFFNYEKKNYRFLYV